MALADNLKKARQDAGLSQQELADKLDLNVRTYGSYERGERDVSTALLRKICQVLKISSDVLLETKTTHSIESNADVLSPDKIHLIPVFGSVAAGFGAYASSDIIEYIPLYVENDFDVEDTICIIVKGQSMYPKIEDGDRIVVRRQDSVDNGRIAVVMIGDEAVVKRVNFDGDRLELTSFNPEYPPRVIEGSDLASVRVVGLVQQVIKAL
jgi:repressor LexA